MITVTNIGSHTATFAINASTTIFHLAKFDTITSPQDAINEDDSWHNNAILVDGTIKATNQATAAVDSSGQSTHITIGQSASIQAYWGVVSYGADAVITNNGSIKAIDTGLFANGENARIVNNGTIAGPAATIGLSLQGKTHAELVNAGTIDFGVSAHADDLVVRNSATGIINGGVDFNGKAGQKTTFTNDGVINKTAFGSTAIHGGAGDETIVNHGTINGTVLLGAGKDLVDNRGGTVSLRIYGQAGNDTYIVDKAEAIWENTGEGIDTVKSTVSINLLASLYSAQELEKLVLIGSSNINAYGNSLDNSISGNAGNNKLKGLDGADRMAGGKGTDILTGGTGTDTFVFRTGYGKDTVTDFKNGTDHFDMKSWAAITDFADLKAHHLSVSGNDLIIHAGSDKLVILDTGKGELDAGDFLF